MPNERQLTVEDLRHWRLIESFVKELERANVGRVMHPTFADARRTLSQAGYLSLFLFGLFNPVVESMRQLCAVTDLKKVRRTTGCAKVSLGSFSEMQGVLEPALLKAVFDQLVQKLPAAKPDPQLQHLQLIAQDGSLWQALPRMAWAEYGVGSQGTAKGVRLHLRFHVVNEAPADVRVTKGKGSELNALREMLVAGQTTVGDRLYGKSYKVMREIDAAKAFFVFRLTESAVVHSEAELPLNDQERALGIVRHAWVQLGANERSIRMRLIQVQAEGHQLWLVTNHSVEQLSAELVAAVYRRRWSIELFFRWLKCILGTRHFFAESAAGVTLQLYLALIAAVLLQLFTGVRPNKRMMEFLRYYFMGWSDAQETVQLLLKYSPKAAPKKA